MSIITSGSIQWLTRLLGIPHFSSQSTDVDDGHVTLVADITRQSGFEILPGGRHGFWLATAFNTHVGVGSLTDVIDFTLAGSNDYGAFDATKEWVWLLGSWVTQNDLSDFSAANIFLTPTAGDRFVGPDAGLTPNSIPLEIFRGTSGTGAFSPGPVFNDLVDTHFPMLVLSPADGVSCHSTSDTAGTVVVDFNLMIWRGPIGLMPPGMS